ncbi:MAG: primosomal protein N' [Clostridia bacterium]|nr:primosomal protein N' [Clostridia bacterium]
MKIARVIVNKTARAVDRLFDYIVPEALRDVLQIGMVVNVPFGKGNTLIEGYVVDFPESSNVENLKEIASLLSNEPLFDQSLLDLIYFMKKRYFSTYLLALKTVVPYGLGLSTRQDAGKLLKGSQLAISQDDAFDVLENIRDKAPMQARIIELLMQNDFVANCDIQMILGCGISAIKSLEKKGVIELTEIEVFRNPVDYSKIEPTKALVPTKEQAIAINRIAKSLSDFHVFLLHGVTGSGKTEVFLQCIDMVLSKGQSAIVLVPEISLTPQMISRFAGRFGKKIAVLHSRLSLGERNDEYKRIKSGEAKVVIGVRSAVFAPVQNLGLIVMDEEHETSYKSQTVPAYHTREIAAVRAKQSGVPLVLASATPSVESYYKAQKGKYELLTLNTRAKESASMPNVQIVDMRRELADGNRSLFSQQLANEIRANLDAGRQTILFLNRRGFSTFISCRSCGYVVKCPRCNIALTYHKNKNHLTCHYCGYTQRNLNACPECSSNYIKHFGTGTQKVEEELLALFPEASILRMDLDTVSAKNSHQKILEQFEKEKIDILIGTQMVTKGLDFENVTLVGVLAADMSLNQDDYRANEKTFDIITQVSGRAGRGAHAGRAVIQTYMPENSVLNLACMQDYSAFYKEEISLRQALLYPPLCDLLSIVFTSFNENAATSCAKQFATFLQKEFKKEQADILGPSPCSFYKINNKYRKRILIKCKLNDTIIRTVSDYLARHYKSKESKFVTVSAETNPVHIL